MNDIKIFSESDKKQIKEDLEYSKRPLYFFHDDADGLCSFLQFYRYRKEGKGVVVKTHPNIDSKFLKIVETYDPDKIFILDIAKVEQEFIDKVKRPIIWIDHHEPQERHKIKYFNPRKKENNNIPVSKLCYDLFEEDLWIATVGSIGDWHIPDFIDEFRTRYPGYLDKNIKTPEKALFNSKLGTLVKIFNFILKGNSKDALKYVKILTRIQEPDEILLQKNPSGKFVYKKFKNLNKEYEALLQDIIKTIGKEKLIVYTYKDDRTSFTGDVTNELLSLYPNQVILVGREKSGEMKCSLRSPKNIPVSDKLKKALINIQGYGGGHENACGVVVKKEDFNNFVEQFKKELNI